MKEGLIVMIIENKELKTTGKKTKKRFINFGLKEPFEDGTVTVIHQEQFNQLKKEFKQLEENVENPITEEDIQSLENKIEGLQKENQELKTINEEISEELKDKSIKLELALNNKQFEEASLSKDKTISILEEDKKKLEGKVEAYEHELAAIDELKDEIHSLKLALGIVLSKYEALKNRSLIGRLLNSNVEETDEYKRLIEDRPVYTAIDTDIE